MLNINNIRRISKAHYGLRVSNHLSDDIYIDNSGYLLALENARSLVGELPEHLREEAARRIATGQAYIKDGKLKNGLSFNTRFTEFSKKNLGLFQGLGKGADIGRGMLFSNLAANDSNLTNNINNNYDSLSSSLMAFSPVGTIVGGAMKVGAFVGDALQSIGGGTDQMTTIDKLGDSSLFSWNIGALNGFLGKHSKDFSIDLNLLARLGGSYTGSYNFMRDIASKAGKKYGLASSGERREVDKGVDTSHVIQNKINIIDEKALDTRALGRLDINGLKYQSTLNNTFDSRFALHVKNGAKLIKEWEPTINLKVDWEPEIIIEFKQGGKTEELDAPKIEKTNQKNIIPDGALHKNKHHMENDEHITKKGIPVVDNNGEQLAEIELNEIIFTLEVTKKLEELQKEGTDKAAIEAGKLLVKEILFNTEDNTGLINSLKKGGTINA